MATTKKPAAKSTPVPVATALMEQLPADWQRVLETELAKPYLKKLEQFLAKERAEHQVYPPTDDVFNAFRATPFDKIKVVILGQDPYHGPGQAHGMCFSVRPGVRPPPSLVNMFKELHNDLGCAIPNHGNLEAWAKRGVMLLNAVLTVRQGEPNSHKNQGWEQFTDAVIQAVEARETPVVFLLWGAYARKKAKLIKGSQHRIIEGAHPSPLSASKFFGSQPYSAVNAALKEVGEDPIDWQVADR